MSVKIQCPQCRHVLKFGDESVGRKVRCPSCRSVLRISSAAVAPESEAEPDPGSASVSGTESSPMMVAEPVEDDGYGLAVGPEIATPETPDEDDAYRVADEPEPESDDAPPETPVATTPAPDSAEASPPDAGGVFVENAPTGEGLAPATSAGFRIPAGAIVMAAVLVGCTACYALVEGPSAAAATAQQVVVQSILTWIVLMVIVPFAQRVAEFGLPPLGEMAWKLMVVVVLANTIEVTFGLAGWWVGWLAGGVAFWAGMYQVFEGLDFFGACIIVVINWVLQWILMMTLLSAVRRMMGME